MEHLNILLKQLTFDDLEQWAGKTIVDRGRLYRARVDQLQCTQEGDLVAWVFGTQKYATQVHLDPEGRHGWFCTCPYGGGPCKHAVAVILAAAQQIKNNGNIPLLDENDDLALVLCTGSDQETDWGDGMPAPPETVRGPGQGGRGSAGGTSKLHKLLADKSREEMIALLAQLVRIHPDIEQFVRESEQLRTGQVVPVLRSLRKEINRLTDEPAWRNHWNQEGSVPDYSHVQRQFQALLDAGHYDHLLDLGDDLWHKGSDQVGESDDDGETASALGDCLKIVLKAIPHASLSRSRQLLWVIERRLDDEFGLLESGEEILEKSVYTAADWLETATALEHLLAAQVVPKTVNYSDTYRRQRLVDRLIDAYRRCNAGDRIQPLLEREVEICRNYDQLVAHLLQAGERDQARQWCVRGFQKTVQESPGLASALQKQLRSMAEEEKRSAMAAAYRAQDFFERTSVDTYKELRKAAEKSGCWPRLRELLLAYLETGQRPDLPSKKGEALDWPLPEPEVSFPPPSKGRTPSFSKQDVLIDIAILEKRLDDVVRLYETMKKDCVGGRYIIGEKVAKAVAQTHPGVSLTIWRKMVDSLVAQVKPKAYNDAAAFLRKMRTVYETTNRLSEWQALLSELRQTHKAKRRLLDVLDALSSQGKKIVE